MILISNLKKLTIYHFATPASMDIAEFKLPTCIARDIAIWWT